MGELLNSAITNTENFINEVVNKDIDEFDQHIQKINNLIMNVSKRGKTSVTIDIIWPLPGIYSTSTTDDTKYLYFINDSYSVNEIRARLVSYYKNEKFDVDFENFTGKINISWLKMLNKKSI